MFAGLRVSVQSGLLLHSGHEKFCRSILDALSREGLSNQSGFVLPPLFFSLPHIPPPPSLCLNESLLLFSHSIHLSSDLFGETPSRWYFYPLGRRYCVRQTDSDLFLSRRKKHVWWKTLWGVAAVVSSNIVTQTLKPYGASEASQSRRYCVLLCDITLCKNTIFSGILFDCVSDAAA